jgi:hypothetical protein
MISSLERIWPPAPSPTQMETGTKTLNTSFAGITHESLSGLHDPAWWSGIKIAAGDSQIFRVRLVKSDGSPAFDCAQNYCEWTQPANIWKRLPWAIPAMMATAMDLMVEVSTETQTPIFISIKISFHEMTLLSPRDRYLFMNKEGRIIHQWNGKQRLWGSPVSGDPPTWRTIHRLIPPEQLLERWDDSKVFCIHEWDEQVTIS